MSGRVKGLQTRRYALKKKVGQWVGVGRWQKMAVGCRGGHRRIRWKSGKVSKVEGMLNEMIQYGFQPTISVLTSLVHCYAKAR
ncbi:hypothetical protein JHK86_009909 [Glycine max]|nr:hypothetical protein JHK86_009909 [Glycine max]